MYPQKARAWETARRKRTRTRTQRDIAPRHERRHSAQKGMRADADASAGAIATWRSQWSGNISDGAPRGSARRESVRHSDAGRLANVPAFRFCAPGWFPPSARGTGGRKPMKRRRLAEVAREGRTDAVYGPPGPRSGSAAIS